jgi:xanthine dehydrogenase iron-sulfur cluster and FAD-binding subunit A
MVLPLLWFDTELQLVGPEGERRLPLNQFLTGTDRTAILPGEILVGVHLPPCQPCSGSPFLKVMRRQALDCSVVCVGDLVTLEEDRETCREARIAKGAAASVPFRPLESENLLIGQRQNEDAVHATVERATAAAQPITDVRASAEYRHQLIGGLVKRAVSKTWDRAKEQAIGGMDMIRVSIVFNMNGENYPIEIEPHHTLLEELREDLALTGTKTNCLRGESKACTVLVDVQAINSCLYLAVLARDKRIVTIEGAALAGNLHPVQKVFIHLDAVQCGYCTPIMILSAKALLDHTPSPTDEKIARVMAGNLCWCTGYVNICRAI